MDYVCNIFYDHFLRQTNVNENQLKLPQELVLGKNDGIGSQQKKQLKSRTCTGHVQVQIIYSRMSKQMISFFCTPRFLSQCFYFSLLLIEIAFNQAFHSDSQGSILIWIFSNIFRHITKLSKNITIRNQKLNPGFPQFFIHKNILPSFKY